jgi:flagellar biosynthesis activator protein FlaF
MSLQAYQRAAQRAESPRDTEYRLFTEVTRALIEAAQADPSDLKTRVAALDWNRRLWTALAADCASAQNRLPDSLRASIVSLSMFVGRHTSETIRGGGSLDLLIDVNRSIMQGLKPGAPAPAPTSARAA